jgi:hypothetical protein
MFVSAFDFSAFHLKKLAEKQQQTDPKSYCQNLPQSSSILLNLGTVREGLTKRTLMWMHGLCWGCIVGRPSTRSDRSCVDGHQI